MGTILTSLFVIALGAILRYAVTADVHGIVLPIVGLVLMIVGFVALILGVFFAARSREHGLGAS